MTPDKNYLEQDYKDTGIPLIAVPTTAGTGSKAVGFEIPRFDQLKEFVFSACKVIPTARLVAWDVAVTENDFEMVEGNYQGDPGVMQYADRCGHLNILKKYR